MKVERIIPCICIDHIPDTSDSGTYGMPTLQLYSCGEGRSYRFIPKCPACGRGGMFDFTSDYKALKHWNKLQEDMWKSECTDFWTGEIKADLEPWRKEMFHRLFPKEIEEAGKVNV